MSIAAGEVLGEVEIWAEGRFLEAGDEDGRDELHTHNEVAQDVVQLLGEGFVRNLRLQIIQLHVKVQREHILSLLHLTVIDPFVLAFYPL